MVLNPVQIILVEVIMEFLAPENRETPTTWVMLNLALVAFVKLKKSGFTKIPSVMLNIHNLKY